MTAQVDALIAQLRQQRASAAAENVVCVYDTLIAALQALDASTGTVTSVGLALDAGLYTVSGSPVVAAGTLTGTLNTQTANTVFAGPAAAGPSKPTFRALVAGDLPAGTGTVTSVGITFGGNQAAQWDTSGSPVTTSGNIILTMKNQAANLVLASPASGAASNPTFRALVNADINGLTPTFGASASVSGTTPSFALTDAAWAAAGYLQSGVNSTGTGAGDYFFFNAPAGKKISLGVNNLQAADITVAAVALAGSLAVNGDVSGHVLGVAKNVNNVAIVSMTNTDGGNSAQALYQTTNGTNTLTAGTLGTGFATSGEYQANRSYIAASGTAGLVIGTANGAPVITIVNNAEANRSGTDGSFLVGTTTNGGWSTVAAIAAQKSSGFALSAYSTGTTGGDGALLARVDNAACYFSDFRFTTTQIGSITPAGGGTITAFNTTSGRAVKWRHETPRDFVAIARGVEVFDAKMKGSPAHRMCAVFAEDLAEIYPEAVSMPDKPGRLPGVDYGRLAPLALLLGQAAYAKCEALENTIAELRADIAALQNPN